MLRERLQILVTREQRRRLDAEAKRRQTSVGGLIREAIDARFGAVTPADRLRAVEEIRERGGGRFLPPDEINRLVGEERETAVEPTPRARRR